MSRPQRNTRESSLKIHWAPALPEHWSEVPVRWYFKNLDGKRVPLNSSQRAEIPGEVPYWGSGGIVGHIDRYLFETPVLLVGEDGAPFFEPTRPVSFVVQGKSWINNHIHVMQGGRGLPLEWYCHAFNCVDYSQYIDGTTREKLTQEGLKSIFLPAPPPSEAEQLVTVLDRETALINALIERKTHFIELLKEKRQALITQAVTKGLDPTVPMKDSGVEWIGEVPAHWVVKKIAHLTPVKRGASPRPIDDPRYFDDEGEFGWVRIQDVTACNGNLRSTRQQLSALGSSKSVKMVPGKLFLSIAATVGVPCITAIKCCIHDGFVYFPNLRLSPLWLYRIFESRECFVGLGKMGTQLNLNTETVGGISVPVPPPDEIDRILENLNSRTTVIDRLMERSIKSVDLLKERRSALITAAVTGQIDLREEFA